MSDFPQGPGWWQASDDRWYAPELHPEYREPSDASPPPAFDGPADATPGLADFDPPRSDQRVGYPGPAPGSDLEGLAQPSLPPQGAQPLQPPQPGQVPQPGQPPQPGRVPQPGQVPPPGQAQRYPSVPAKGRSKGKVLAIVLGALFLLVAGGCGVFIYSFRDQIADAGIDFGDGVPTDDEATCQVTGVGFSTNYEITATLTAADDAVTSHYQLDLEVLSADGEVLGSEVTVFRDMSPGEQRTEDVFHAISGPDDPESTSCQVIGVLRVPA